MSTNPGSTGLRSESLYDRIMAERHRQMVNSAAHRLARELNSYGCPLPRSELARRCGVDHWSKATLDEAVEAGERDGLLKALHLGWVAPMDHVVAADQLRTIALTPRLARLHGRKHH